MHSIYNLCDVMEQEEGGTERLNVDENAEDCGAVDPNICSQLMTR